MMLLDSHLDWHLIWIKLYVKKRLIFFIYSPIVTPLHYKHRDHSSNLKKKGSCSVQTFVFQVCVLYLSIHFFWNLELFTPHYIWKTNIVFWLHYEGHTLCSSQEETNHNEPLLHSSSEFLLPFLNSLICTWWNWQWWLLQIKMMKVPHHSIHGYPGLIFLKWIKISIVLKCLLCSPCTNFITAYRNLPSHLREHVEECKRKYK